ncbi:MAG: asparagine synthase C-terminal domain-containing protein [Thermoplasmata archaeon]
MEPGDRAEWFHRLDGAITTALAPWARPDGPLVLLFSGGVDSGLLAWELRGRPKFTLFTIGSASGADLPVSTGAAPLVGVPGRSATVGTSEVRAVTERLADQLDGLGRTARSVLIAFALAVQLAPEGTVLCGQGADELFLGYAHFRGLGTDAAAARADEDLRRLIDVDWPRSVRATVRLGRVVVAPYLDPAFVEAARSIPIGHRVPIPHPKALFRDWARHRGLPAAIADRPKRALQFGSGVDRLLVGGRRVGSRE